MTSISQHPTTEAVAVVGAVVGVVVGGVVVKGTSGERVAFRDRFVLFM
jgi:hypothetical protein